MENSLNVVLGAGFSYYAGLPLGKGIDAYLDRDVRGKLLMQGSSEWQWVDGKSDAFINNGQIHWEHASYSYILQELVIQYKKASDGSFQGYEDFFQFTSTVLREKERVDEIYENAKARFAADYPELPEGLRYWEAFDQFRIDPLKIIDIINYLIADVLFWKKSDDELLDYYGVFLDQIRAYDTINIFSLNHDLLLEHLLKLSGMEFSDGFCRENAQLAHEEVLQRTFQNKFNSAIRIHKLHGSIDNHKFLYAEESSGGWLSPNGEYTYFKPDSYEAKHYVMRLNNAGEVVQRFNTTVVPQFITGKNKDALIESDYMYSALIERMKKALNSKSVLMIVGYSFRDNHINSIIEEACLKHQPHVIHINPCETFPFNCEGAHNLSDLSELNTFQRGMRR